jgi:hypothetical protein
MIRFVQWHNNIAFLVGAMRRLRDMRPRLFLAFAQILAEGGGKAVGIGFGHRA